MKNSFFVFIIVLFTLSRAGSFAGGPDGFGGPHGPNHLAPSRGVGPSMRPIPVEITNNGETAMACKLSLAHWFAVDIGHADPGETVQAMLWSDIASGTVYVLNEARDRMPVERFWCGPLGQSWQHRFEMSLHRKSGAGNKPIQMTCQSFGRNFSCHAD